jgi:hypothetical protein
MTRPPVADLKDPDTRLVVGTSDERDGASFRDPSAFVLWHDGEPYRQIRQVPAASPLKPDASRAHRSLSAAGDVAQLLAYR